jgi:hypothetical protein
MPSTKPFFPSSKELARYYVQSKGGDKPYPFIVHQFQPERDHPNCDLPSDKWDDLHFSPIPGNPVGISRPKFFSLKHPDRILWYGLVASFDKHEKHEKHVLMVLYFDAEKDCIAHSCFLIQCDPDTYLRPSLYVTNQSSYESFKRLPVKDRFFSQEIKANCIEVCSSSWVPLERSGRLSNDDGKTWRQFTLTLNRETMQVQLTLKPSDV